MSDVKDYLNSLKNKSLTAKEYIIERKDIYEVSSEDYLGENNGVNICAVIPSYKREEWLLRFIPDMCNNLLIPLNENLGGSSKLIYRIYIQGCDESFKDRIHSLSELYSSYIKIILVPLKKPEDTITKLRLDYMSDTLSDDNSITHLMMADDDVFISDTHSVVRDFMILINSIIRDTGPCVYNIIPYTHSSKNLKWCFLGGKDVSYGIAWLMRFQILSRSAFEGMCKSGYYKLSDLYKVKVSEDSIIILLAYLYCGRYKTVFGFNSFVHIGVEEIFKSSPKSYTHRVLRNEGISKCLRSEFNFGNSGFNIGGSMYAKVISDIEERKGSSIQYLYPELFIDRGNKSPYRWGLNYNNLLSKEYLRSVSSS